MKKGKFLRPAGDERAKQQLPIALRRLRGNDDFKTVLEFLIDPSVQYAEKKLKNLLYTDPDMPQFQAAARLLEEFKELLRTAGMDVLG